jgi:hypothetical protein
MPKAIRHGAPVWLGAALLVTGGALLGCSSHAAQQHARAEVRMVYFAMPG